MEAVKLENIWEDWCIEGEPLGSGSFGTVYKARKMQNTDFGREYYSAVKVIRVPSDDSEIRGFLADGMSLEEIAGYYGNALKGLVGEIDLMESLKGAPNIVIIEDYKVLKNADNIGWTIYIRMELLKNLNQYRIEHPFSVEDVIHLGIDMCSALEYCGKKQILHRDIKPDNIFVNAFGDFKLGDFGIARQLEMTHGNLSQKGTSAYMAPEIFRRQPYNSSVDIYSLGMVLYRLLNGGRLPFMPAHAAGPVDTQKALERRLNGEPLPPPSGCDNELFEIIAKACEADMYKRWKSPGLFKSALIKYLENYKSHIPAPDDGKSMPGEKEEVSSSEGKSLTEDFDKIQDKTIHMVVDDEGRTRGTWVMPEAASDSKDQDGQRLDMQAREIREEYQNYHRKTQETHQPHENRETARPDENRETARSNENKRPGNRESSDKHGNTERDKKAFHTPRRSYKKIIVGFCCGAAVFGIIFFKVPISMRDTFYDKVKYAVSDEGERAVLYVEKGRQDISASKYEEAMEYFKKALEEDPQSLDAHIGALHAAYYWEDRTDTDDYSTAEWYNMQDILTAIGQLSESPDDDQKGEIADEVDGFLYYFFGGYELNTAIDEGNSDGLDLTGQLTAYFANYDQAASCLNGKADLSAVKEKRYEDFLDELYQSGMFPDTEKALLAQAITEFPDNEDFVNRQTQINNDALAQLDVSVDEALAAGDLQKAYEICASMQSIDEGHYNDTTAKIQNFENTQNFLITLKALMDARDYEGMKNTIQADTTYGGGTYYLVDGVYKTGVESGTGLIYDSNGIYFGVIENNIRKGQGSQFRLYSNGKYSYLEGSWDGQANGECVCTRWDSDGDIYTVSGNYTDGYENGTMTISWTSSGRDWTSQYTAENGTIITDGETDSEGKYIYARTYAQDGASAWWTTDDLESYGVRIVQN